MLGIWDIGFSQNSIDSFVGRLADQVFVEYAYDWARDGR